MPETPLITYLKLQRALDRDILRSLQVAATSVDGELRRLQAKSGSGAEMRRSQLRRSQAAINARLAGFYDNLGQTVDAASARAAAAGAETMLRESKDLLRGVLSAADYDYLVRSAEASASQSLSVLEKRVSGSSYIPLSESVYNSQALTTGHIDDLVNSALARGASAAELAKDVRAYINPNTPGGVRYASMRLGRTELNNAFHAAQVTEAQDSPFILALRWHLSGSHPVPDECNQYAEEEHFKGGGAGVFRPEEVPRKPHPQCLCFTTPETPSDEEFMDSFMAGEYDSYFDDHEVAPSVFPKVGSQELDDRLKASESARLELEAGRFNKKRNLNSERGWTSSSSQALENYADDGIRFNEMARDPKKFAEGRKDYDIEFYASQTKLVDDLIAANPLSADVTVARGVTHDMSNIKTGDFIADPGFLSTSTDYQTAVSFASKSRTEAIGGFRNAEEYAAHVKAAKQDGWVFITNAPKGTKAIYGDKSQKEIIFGRGTKQRVTAVDPNTKTIYTEVLP